jgi:hypothetical protein
MKSEVKGTAKSEKLRNTAVHQWDGDFQLNIKRYTVEVHTTCEVCPYMKPKQNRKKKIAFKVY